MPIESFNQRNSSLNFNIEPKLEETKSKQPAETKSKQSLVQDRIKFHEGEIAKKLQESMEPRKKLELEKNKFKPVVFNTPSPEENQPEKQQTLEEGKSLVTPVEIKMEEQKEIEEYEIVQLEGAEDQQAIVLPEVEAPSLGEIPSQGEEANQQKMTRFERVTRSIADAYHIRSYKEAYRHLDSIDLSSNAAITTTTVRALELFIEKTISQKDRGPALLALTEARQNIFQGDLNEARKNIKRAFPAEAQNLNKASNEKPKTRNPINLRHFQNQQMRFNTAFQLRAKLEDGLDAFDAKVNELAAEADNAHLQKLLNELKPNEYYSDKAFAVCHQLANTLKLGNVLHQFKADFAAPPKDDYFKQERMYLMLAAIHKDTSKSHPEIAGKIFEMREAVDPY